MSATQNPVSAGVARDSANETVERGHCMSAAIGLRNTPEVKKRTGPLHTHSPTTAPATTHQGLPSLALRTASSGLPTKRAYMGSPDGRGGLRHVRPAMRPTERSGTVSEAGYRRISRIGYCVTSVTRCRRRAVPSAFAELTRISASEEEAPAGRKIGWFDQSTPSVEVRFLALPARLNGRP